MNLINLFTFLLLSSISTVTAINDRRLYSNSLVNCMKNNSDIIPNYFNVVFDAETKSINYDISITAKIEGKLRAHATVYAFGFDIIHENIDLCDLNLKQFCPITPSHMEVQAVEYISDKYVNKIPNIAYTFPNLDAVARLIITDENNGLLGCLQASFNNGKRVSHDGAKWATAVVAGLGLLVSGMLSLFGNSASASRMSAAAISLFTYFQSVVIIGMVAVEEVPPIANDWAENLAWSMGLIRITFMQEVFRWFVQATGGTPTQYLTSGVKAILTQRSIDKIASSSFFTYIYSFFVPSYHSNLEARANADQNTKVFIPMADVESNDYLLVLRGIDRIGYDSNIEPSSIVVTGFTFFILCLYVLIGVFFIYRYLNHIVSKQQKSNWLNKNLETASDWRPTFKGMLARYIMIGFPQLLILSLWEFTKVDSGAVVTIAVLFLILTLATMGFSCFQVLRFGRQSLTQHGNPAAILYGNPEVLSRYGFLYTMLNANKYWWCLVALSYLFVKCFFVALSQSSGKTQAMTLWLLDMFYLGLMCHHLPYLDKFTNILSVFIQLITTINSFFFTFFSGIYNQPIKVSSVMGLIFFIMNAAVSLILLIVILALAVITIFFKNPDARFSPTKDDRTSFQRKHQTVNQFNNDDTNELFALGAVAKDHNENWENDMVNLHDLNNKSEDLSDSPNESTYCETKNNEQPQGGFAGFMDKLARAKSITRGKSLLGKKNKSDVELNEKKIKSVVDEPEQQHNMQYHDLLDNNNVEIESNPFTNKVEIEDPFQVPSTIPYIHARNQSHISGITNETGGGLSVYGEPINVNDYQDETSRINVSRASHLPAHDELESDGNSSYDFDDETDQAQRRY